MLRGGLVNVQSKNKGVVRKHVVENGVKILKRDKLAILSKDNYRNVDFDSYL